MLLEAHQTREFVWSVYSSLRENVNQMARKPDSHLIMSLVGYEKRGPDGRVHTETKVRESSLKDLNFVPASPTDPTWQLKKICQSIVQEIAGFALEASELVPPENLRRITVVAWEELFDLIKEAFKLCGRSDTISVLNDPQYLASLVTTIRRIYASDACAHLRSNLILTSYVENLEVGKEHASPTSIALQMCYWGGRIG